MRQRMARVGLEACGQLHQLSGASAAACFQQAAEAGAADAQGAGLIEEHGVERSGGFDHVAATKQDAGLGGAAGAHGDRRRRGQPQRARAGHHQHGNAQLQAEHKRGFCGQPQASVRAVGMDRRGSRQHLGPELSAPEPPKDQGGERQQHHRHAETASHPIGEPLNRPLARLGLLHQRDDSRHGAVAPRAHHLQQQWGLEVEAASCQLAAHAHLLGQRFTGEARNIQVGEALQHAAIHGHPISRQQLQAITRAQGTHPHRAGDRLGPRAHYQQSLIGLKPRQLLQGAAGAEAGTLLQKPPEQHKAQQGDRLIEKALPTHRRPDQRHQAGEVGAGHAQAHQRVHARGTGQGRTQTAHQDRAAREGESQAGHQGMHANVGQPRQGQLAHLGQVPRCREQQQHQGHHQLLPALPPALLLSALRWRARLLLTAMGLIAHGEQSLDQPFGGITACLSQQTWIQPHPGGAIEQAHTGLAHPRLSQQALLHGAHAATAFHTLHLEQQGSHRLRGRFRAAAHGAGS